MIGIRNPYLLATLAIQYFASIHCLASPVLYTDRTAWEADLGTAIAATEDLNSTSADTTLTAVPVPIGALMMSTTASSPTVDVPPYDPVSNVPAGAIDGTTWLDTRGIYDVNQFIIVTLPLFVNAFGVDVMNFDLDSDRTEVIVGGANIGAVPFTTLPTPTVSFLGVIDTAVLFNTIEIRPVAGAVNAYNGYDNFSYTTVAIPEPSAFLLLGLVGVALWVEVLRRKTLSTDEYRH